MISKIDLPSLALLEELGYISTMETEEDILIRTHGHIMSEDGQDFFCILDGEHD